MEQFLINEDEKSRILNLHKTRSSGQYLKEERDEDDDDKKKKKLSYGNISGKGYSIKILKDREEGTTMDIKVNIKNLSELIDELKRFEKNL